MVDTTLAKLLTLLPNDSQESTEQLLALLSLPNDIIMSEVEPFLEKRKYVVAKVMEKNGEWARVLDILREYVGIFIFFFLIIIGPKTESFEQVGGKWKPRPYVQRSCARIGYSSDKRSRCGYMGRSRTMAGSEKTRESPRREHALLQRDCNKSLTDIPQSGDYQSSSSRSITLEFPSPSPALS